MATSEDNLKAAFAGESQANRTYLFFAAKADEEGQKQIARLFRAAAEAETVHARAHFHVLKRVKSIAENLDAAIGGESYEHTTMYPEFIKVAESEGNKEARLTFHRANEVEKIHHRLFQEAKDALESGKTIAEAHYYVCPVCGNTVLGEAPDRCPICSQPKSAFKKIE